MADRSEIASVYTDRVARFGRDAEAMSARSRLLSNLRGLSFAVFVGAALFALFGEPRAPAALASVLGLLAFAGLVVVHTRVIGREDELRRWERVNRDATARLTAAWRDLPDDGARFATEGETAQRDLADDLDLFGPGSLFQRVCTARTHFGQAALARLLTESADLDQSRLRQEAARALAPELETRQRLEALALAVVEAPDSGAGRAGYLTKKRPHTVPDPEPLLRWAEGPPELSHRKALVWTARILPAVTLTGITLAFALGLPAATWGVPLFVQVLLSFRTREETTRVFNAVSSTEGAFMRYGPMLELLESLDLPSDLVRTLQERVLSGDQRPSVSMRQFERAVGWFELRHNGLVHPFVNALLLWDVHCVLGLERWQQRSGQVVRKWFVALGELEALAAFGALAHDEPAFSWPDLEDGSARFEAEGLGHPLIAPEQRVVNDVALPEPGTALLVTGSNMSGKSTLLRSMGLAAVLAFSGAPVCARRLSLSGLAVRTSVRVRDSLEHGVSHFYAEIRKLKAVLDATDGDRPVLFLLDEILHGTNSRERQIGARWILGELLIRGALGAVSTHDLELCRLTGDLAERVRLVHFREDVEGDSMTFDYELRVGPVTSGNALELMRLVGLPVPKES